MSFFTGEYECKLDAKGRIVLPSRVKAALPESGGNQVVVRRGFEPCLVLYSVVEYRKIFTRIAGLNEFNPEYRKLQRNFFRGNTQLDLDSNGRFLIPKMMIKYAQLEKEAIVVGMGNRAEIWSSKLYENYLMKDPEEISTLAQKYLDL